MVVSTRRLGADKYKLATIFFPPVHIPLPFKRILTGKSWAVRAWLIFASNSVMA